MNNTMMEVDPEQFMKRNDLFNNNHTRQTTNIPFLIQRKELFIQKLQQNKLFHIKITLHLKLKATKKLNQFMDIIFLKEKEDLKNMIPQLIILLNQSE